MTTKNATATAQQLANFTSRKVTGLADTLSEAVPDSLTAWMARYLTFAVVGVRSPAVAEKIALHLCSILVRRQQRWYVFRSSTALVYGEHQSQASGSGCKEIIRPKEASDFFLCRLNRFRCMHHVVLMAR